MSLRRCKIIATVGPASRRAQLYFAPETSSRRLSMAEAGYLTSTTALELEELPPALAVIGANAIGLELGQLFSHLGSKVTLIEMLPRVAPFEEPEVSEAIDGDPARRRDADTHLRPGDEGRDDQQG